MSTLWVLTANRSFAKIFEIKGLGRHVKEIFHFDNSEAFKRNDEIYSDRPGRAFDRMGGGRHALTDDKATAHDHEQHVFINQLIHTLEQGKENKAYDELAFVAPAHMLNSLSKVLSHPLKKCLVKEVAKDLPEYLSEQERIEHLCKYLDLWNRHPV